MGLARVGVLEVVQAFGVGGHQAVFDAVVNHLDEVASTGRAAVEIALLGSAGYFFAARRAIDIAAARRKRFENGIESLHDVGFASDHLAITAFEAPDAAAGADVAIVDALGGEFFGAAHGVGAVGVSAFPDELVL